MTSLVAPTVCLPRRGPVKQTGMGWEAWLRWRLALKLFNNIQLLLALCATFPRARTYASRCGAGHTRTDHQAANQGLLPGKHNMNKRAQHEEGLRLRSSEGRDPAFMTCNHVCWGHYGGLVAFRHLPTYLPRLRLGQGWGKHAFGKV